MDEHDSRQEQLRRLNPVNLFFAPSPKQPVLAPPPPLENLNHIEVEAPGALGPNNDLNHEAPEGDFMAGNANRLRNSNEKLEAAIEDVLKRHKQEVKAFPDFENDPRDVDEHNDLRQAIYEVLDKHREKEAKGKAEIKHNKPHGGQLDVKVVDGKLEDEVNKALDTNAQNKGNTS